MNTLERSRNELPDELRGFNWGAFGLTWIWGLANRTYFAFLVFVPLLGWLIVPFVLGFKGNDWAWRNREWRSLDEFRNAQRSWSWFALFAWVGCIGGSLILVSVVGSTLKSSEAYSLALGRLIADPVVSEHLGQPLEAGTIGGNVRVAGGTGSAEIDFPLTGPKGSAHAYAVATKQVGQWSLDRLELELANGQRILLGAEPNAPAPSAEPAQLQPPAAQPANVVRFAGGGTSVRGKLKRDQIEEVLARGRPALEACFNGTPPAEGTEFAIKLIIAPDGRVQTAALEESSSQFERTVSPCISREARAWSFPTVPQGGIVVVTHTIRIEPA